MKQRLEQAINKANDMTELKIHEIIGVSKPTWYRWSRQQRETEIKARLSQEIGLTEKEVLGAELAKLDCGETTSGPISGKYPWEIEEQVLADEIKAHLDNLTNDQKATLELFKGSVMFGNDPRLRTKKVEIPELEGITLFPRNRISEFFGDKGVGKTTLSLMVAKVFLSNSPKSVLFIDTEETTDSEYVANRGLDPSRVDLIHEKDAETALNKVIDGAKSGNYSLIILDSVANLMPKCEVKGELGDKNMGARAFLMNQLIRKITPLTKTNTFLFVNQVRDNMDAYGSPYVTPGGHAIKHGASLRLQLRKTAKRSICKVEKSKIGPDGFEKPITLFK